MPRNDLDGTVRILFVWRSMVRGFFGVNRTGIGRVHAQWLENTGTDEIIPRTMGDLSNRVARHNVHHVLVLKLGPKTHIGSRISQPPNQLLSRCFRENIPKQVGSRNAGAVREKIADGYIFVGEWVAKMKKRNVLIYLAVPLHFSLVHDDGNGRRGEDR